jgi:hypothetical protein
MGVGATVVAKEVPGGQALSFSATDAPSHISDGQPSHTTAASLYQQSCHDGDSGPAWGANYTIGSSGRVGTWDHPSCKQHD